MDKSSDGVEKTMISGSDPIAVVSRVKEMMIDTVKTRLFKGSCRHR